MSRRSDATTSPWPQVLWSNWPWPVLVALLWPLGWLIEREEGGLDPYLALVLMLVGINVILAVSLQLINGISGQFSLGHAGFMAVGAYFAGFPTAQYAPDFNQPGAVGLFYVATAATLGAAIVPLGAIVLLVRSSRRIHASLPGLLLILIVAWFVIDVAVANNAGQAAPGGALVWSASLRGLVKLFTGIIEHGQHAAAWVSAQLPAASLKPLTLMVALLGGGACAAATGLIVGLPTLRLRGDYLAIATIGFSQIILVAFTNADPMGGARGLSVPFYANPPDPEAGMAAHYITPWIFGWAIATVLVIWRLAHSPKGRAIRAVREDEIAAAAMGIDPTHHKVLSFVIGAFFAGVAGGLYAHYIGFINPSTFGFMRSVELVVMVTLGGLGSIWGAAIAAAALTWLPEFLRSPADWINIAGRLLGSDSAIEIPPKVGRAFAWVSERRLVVYSLLLIVIMLARAKGMPNPLKFWRRPRPGANPLA